MKKDYDLNNFVKKLQKEIDKKEKEIYSKKVIKEYKNPKNFGLIKKPDAHGNIKGPCGDSMKITLKIRGEKIINARFLTDGCGATIACGSMLTKIIKGKELEEVISISKKDLIEKLDGLPKDHSHCAKLAINTLKDALKNI